MANLNSFQLMLVLGAGAMMAYVMLKSITQNALADASDQISDRRAKEAQRRAEDAAAEAAGRAAALEPLALNADGTVEEPITGVVEVR